MHSDYNFCFRNENGREELGKGTEKNSARFPQFCRETFRTSFRYKENAQVVDAIIATKKISAMKKSIREFVWSRASPDSVPPSG